MTFINFKLSDTCKFLRQIPESYESPRNECFNSKEIVM